MKGTRFLLLALSLAWSWSAGPCSAQSSELFLPEPSPQQATENLQIRFRESFQPLESVLSEWLGDDR